MLMRVNILIINFQALVFLKTSILNECNNSVFWKDNLSDM